jgi:hypothetical protein
MVLGMTHGELGLVLFIFALVYSAAWVPKLGAAVGRALAGKQPPGPHA